MELNYISYFNAFKKIKSNENNMEFTPRDYFNVIFCEIDK